MTLPVAILAGGLATRLRAATQEIPKALVEVAGLPFAVHQIMWLHRQGIERIIFCVGYRGEMIRDVLGDGRRWNVSIDYVFDGDRLLGTGGALKRAQPVLGDAFFVMYGDSFVDCDLASIEHAFRAEGRAGLMTVFRNDNRWDRSNVLFVDGRLLRYDKRNHVPEMRHIDYGIGVLAGRALEPFPPDEPFDLAAVYELLVSKGELIGFEVFERFYEIGSIEGLEETRAFLARRSRASDFTS
jgi:MurNAc alpha-1-phosphate uridylyltransferase